MAVRRLQASTSRRGRNGSARSLCFETLDARDLMAVLNVGPGQTFSTIQAAVNNARPNDVIQIAGTGLASGPAGNGFKESVNLSLMGSAVGAAHGSLTIRGIASQTETTTIIAQGGSTFYNSQAFTGNLTLENLTLYAATATAGRDTGLSLNNYSGSLTVSNVAIIDAVDAGIEVVNSSGALLIDDVNITSDSISSPFGLRFVNYAASGNVRDTIISDMSDAAVLIDVSGSTQMNVMFVDVNALRSSGGELPANDGIRATTSGSAVLDLGIASCDFDDIPANSIEVITDGTSKANVTVHDSRITMSDNVGRVLSEPAARFLSRSSSQITLFYHLNVHYVVPGDNLSIQALNNSVIQTTVYDNWFMTPGTASSHRAIVLTSDSSSSSTINADISLNLIMEPFGDAISIVTSGNSTFNVTMEENEILYEAGDVLMPRFGNNVAGIRLETAANSNAQLNTRIFNNTLQTPAQPGTSTPVSVRFLRQSSSGTSRIFVESGGPTITSYLPTVNNNFTAPVTSAGSSANINALALGTLLATKPLRIGNMVWDDANKDGRQQATETGTTGTMLTLTGTETVGGATVTRKTWTSNDGFYSFGALKPGTYVITVAPRAGMDLTGYTGNRTINDVTIDSDFRQGIRNANVTLVAGTSNPNIDAGLIPTDGKLWKNQILAEDVDDNGVLSPLDALLIINDLNAVGARTNLPAPSGGFRPQPFLDVSGDNATSPLDALLVIIRLNSVGAGEPQGEPDPLDLPLVIAPLDAPLESTLSATTSESSLDSSNQFSAAPWEYLPPEFFTSQTSSTQNKSSDSESQSSALDAFFIELAR